mgnify:CR=1 FL=1
MEKITISNELGSIEFSDQLPFRLISIDGNSQGSACEVFKAINQHGQTSGETLYNARMIPCRIAIAGLENGKYSHKALLQNEQQAFKFMQPHLPMQLVYENDIGVYKINVRLEEKPPRKKDVGEVYKYDINFIADNPYWQANEDICFRLGSIVGGFSFPFSFNPTVKFGTWVKTCTIENDTGIETPFTIEMTTVSDYCKITNEKGEFIKVDKPVTDGQKLIIDTYDMTVKLVNADGSFVYANNKVTLDSTYFKLHYGTNVLTLDNGQSTPAIASICYNKLYLGV